MSKSIPMTVVDDRLTTGFDLVGELLSDQQTMTMVERFSNWKDTSHQPNASGGCNVADDDPAQAKYYRSLMPSVMPQPGYQYAFRVDLDSCSGCKACVVACHTLNGLEEEESWRRVGTVSRMGNTPAVDSGEASLPMLRAGEDRDPFALSVTQHVTTACHHCEDPGCLNGCPVKAYVKDPVTGIVRHLDDQCIGCKYCTMMCPYEVPQYSDRLGIVRKCDMCHQRLGAGEAPACVQSCPNEAIRIDVVEVGGKLTDASTRLAPGAPISAITRPTTRYDSRRWDSDDSRNPFAGMRPQDAEVDHVAESHWPLALMLVATQASVGMLLAERLAASAVWLDDAVMPLSATGTNAVVAFVVGAIGLGIAPLHLGQPLRAWRVFLGLRTSWLSREAVLLGKYMGALLVAISLLWQSMWDAWLPAAASAWIPSWGAKAVLSIALLLGIAGLYSSVMIYVATRRSQWRAYRTFFRFFGTASAAGSACTSVCLLIADAPGEAIAFTMAASLFVLSGKLAWEWHRLFGSSVGMASEEDRRAKRLVLTHLGKLKDVRIGTGCLSIACLLVSLLGLSAGSNVVAAIFAGLGSIFLITGEYAERLLYFKSVVHDRMPGTLP